MSLRRKLLLMLVGLVAVSVVAAGGTVWSTLRWKAMEVQFQNHYARSLLAERLRRATYRALKETSDAVFAGDAGARQEFETLLVESERDFKQWAALAHTEAERQEVGRMRQAFDAVVEDAQTILRLMEQSRRDEARAHKEKKLEAITLPVFDQVTEMVVRTDREFNATYRSQANRVRKTTQYLLVGGATGLSVLIVVMAGFFSSRLFRGLRDVELALGDLARGNLSRRVPDPARSAPDGATAEDELTALVRAFNRMTEDLGQTTVSKEYLDRIIESMRDALLVLDGGGTIRGTNPAATALLGWTESELIGRPLTELVDQPMGEGDGDRVGDASRDRMRYLERAFLAKDGRRVPVSFSRSAMRDAQQRGVGFVCVAQDITERKQAEEAVRRSEARYRNLVQTARDIIFTIARDGLISSINPAFESITGWSQAEALGKEFPIFVSPDDAQKAREYLQRVLEGETPRPFELRLRAKAERPLVVEVTITPQMQDTRVIGGLGVARDITERKRAEEQIRAALEEKEVLFKEINHRVKNNLQVISSLLNLQSRQIADREGREVLKESRNRIQAMAFIHDKLYRSEMLARIDFGDYVRSLTEHLLDSYGAGARQIHLVPDIAPVLLGLDTAIPCGLIINELITNSLKHAFVGRAAGEIGVEMRNLPDGNCRVSVRDNGIGLPLNFRIEETRSLGLRLVRTLTEQLRGKLTVASDGGATFEILFPVQHQA